LFKNADPLHDCRGFRKVQTGDMGGVHPKTETGKLGTLFIKWKESLERATQRARGKRLETALLFRWRDSLEIGARFPHSHTLDDFPYTAGRGLRTSKSATSGGPKMLKITDSPLRSRDRKAP
jgi:hypothetical protein